MTLRVDAAIVGGGPAGAIAARRLALLGWRVVLIERGGLNRPKTCGHCLAPRAMPILRCQGLLDLVRDVSMDEMRMLHVHGPNGGSIRSPLASEGCEPGLLVPRERLDQALRQAAADAGAMMLQPASARVQTLHEDGAMLCVTQSGKTMDVHCRLLVGADGVGSAVARIAGLANAEAAGRKYGFSLQLPGDGVATMIEHHTIEMFLAPLGYVGVVRQRDGGLHVAALVAAGAPEFRSDPLTFLHRAAQRHVALAMIADRVGRLDQPKKFLAAGPMPWRPRGVATSCVALVGDAAGYIEPFTGEGMAWAIESASLLGEAVASRGGAWDARAADIYARMWRTRIQQRQRLCRWVSAALERPLVSRWIVCAGAVAPALTRRLVRGAVAA